MSNLNHNYYLLIASLLSLGSFAQAEQADRSKPMEITSDRGCTMDQINGVSTCEGNVVIIQGTLRMNAAKVVATQDKQGRQTLVATGDVVTFRQKLDSGDWIEGQGKQLNYDSSSNLAVLTNSARVKRGGDLVIGNVITYNTVTEIYQVTGGAASGPNPGRVTVILQPKTTPATGAK